MRLKISDFVYRLSCFFLFSCLVGCSTVSIKSNVSENMHTITDMAGREINIPNEIKKVYSTGQPGVIMLYTLCPDKLLGWDLRLTEEERRYINAKYISLPVLGLMQGENNTASKEEILQRAPDIILLMTEIDNNTVATADKMQNTMGIPVVVADFDLVNCPKTYEFLGDLLQEEKRAKTLSDYCGSLLRNINEIASGIQKEDIVTIYYAQGTDGLQTAPKGSSHSEVIDLVGADNVVELNGGTDGRVTINREQLLIYNPDVIITSYGMENKKTGESGFSALINASEEWKLLDAVNANKIYAVPALPFNWLDMPPSVNRLIGLKWLGNLLYPDYYNYDIEEEIKIFYSLFYQKELTQEDVDDLLKGATYELG